ncbi:hypothetical protein BKP45_08350 [Anaerobacillus alkalidiazotrophicus]|uniref:FAD-binding PCMH-type domain-containing protein n=1 Tax=Anaerobacillus alkalidiazotrophicus TaxID=472963 RepID=A0A1S2MAE9_9BACI|nr:FAD binding domain-containing protein [Anaerobacillus alkalidiazotrophicus]OIJ20797.1 hypothetical protein BKP45_08350 [Anaerobacillus alkalidiazotrophicus]
MVTRCKVWRPKNLQEAWSIHSQTGIDQSCFVSGGTWLRTQWEAGLLNSPSDIISLESLEELKKIIVQRTENNQEFVKIGSSTTIADCIKNPILRKNTEALVMSCEKIAAPSIRNQATIGGNILTAVGDTLPALLIYDAELTWYDGKLFESELLEKWLITRQFEPHKNETRLLVHINIPLEENSKKSFYFHKKIGRRKTFTPAIVSVAGKGKINNLNNFQSVTLAVGGGSSLPIKLFEAERVLNGFPFSLSLLKKVHTAIFDEYVVVSDAFMTDQYKKTVAANLITAELCNIVEQGGDQNAVG